MGAITSQITSLTIVFSTVYSDADQRKHQSSASLVFVRGIYRGPVNSPHKWPVTRKMFPFDDFIMKQNILLAKAAGLWMEMWYLICGVSFASMCVTGIPGGCFTNVSRALQNIISKFVCCRNRTSCEHFKLKFCSCAQSHALGTRTKFQLELLTINVVTGFVYFREIILKSSRNVSESNPC